MVPLLASIVVGSALPTDCTPAAETVWAEAVVAYEAGPGVEPAWGDARTALGAPDFSEGTGAVSLGNRGPEAAAELIVTFSSAVLVDGPGPDLTVFEAGPSAEPTELSVSADGVTWHAVGIIEGSTHAVDLRGRVPAGAVFTRVRLRTASERATAAPWAGPDIDAVGLLSACSVPDRIQS